MVIFGNFTSRDAHKRSRIGCVEINLREPRAVRAPSQEPLVVPGAVGLFDDSGAATGCVVIHRGRRYLYYVGWNLGVTVPWRTASTLQ